MRTSRHPSSPSGATIALGGAIISISLVVGHELATATAPVLHSKMLPWILGRGLGLASFLSLTALTAFGLWLRHPWKALVSTPSPRAALLIHASLAGATVSLVVGHLTALALDRFAGVGWMGALVPFASHYRSTPVALGTLALFGMLLVGATASMAGRFLGRRWLPIHQASWLVFAMAWFHGVTAGSDTAALRAVYGIAGGLLMLIWLSGKLVASPVRQIRTVKEQLR
jgi:hypothetical protein